MDPYVALAQDHSSSPPNRIDLLELLVVLARAKKLIFYATLGAAAITVIVVFLIPNSYTARATILPPQQNQSVLTSMLGTVSGIQTLDFRDLGLKTPGDVFVAMLKSRTIEDALINQFDLRKVYNIKRYQDTRKKLEELSEIDPEREGLISIAVTDRDPKRAADIANAWVDELRKLNSTMAITEAAQRRVFFEQKIADEKAQLANVEAALSQLQQKTGLIQPDAQTRALIGAAAEIRAQIAARQVQLQSMRTYATENNPDVKRLQREIAELQAQSAKLSQTDRTAMPDAEGNLQVPTSRVAGVSVDYLHRARELKYHESLYDFLSRQLEAARIDEAKNAVVIQLVDRAVPPERKSGPKRMLTVVLAAVAAVLLITIWVLLREALHRWQLDPIEAERMARLQAYLRSPL